VNCRADIERIAEKRYQEACCLLENKIWDGAYYLAGYSIELLLKSKICKTLGVDNFYELGIVRNEIARVFKTHRLTDLILLSGLQEEYELSKNDSQWKNYWWYVLEWSENSRYEIGKKDYEVINFLTAIKQIMLWIKEKG
jgi:HEPN domain-containing protein